MAKKLKLLLDENIGHTVANALRAQGYDVATVIEKNQGASDRKVLEIARREQRLLVTLDKDFGQLVYAHSKKHYGVVLLRLKDESPHMVGHILSTVLNEFESELVGRFIVASENNVRIR